MSYPDEDAVPRLDSEVRDYRDNAAVELYKEAGVSALVGAHAKISRALSKQADRLEEFFSTPFTSEHAQVLEASTNALVVIEAQLERWHHLIYPNQRPTS